MQYFKPGDKVRRVGEDFDEVKQGDVYTVMKQEGINLYLKELSLSYTTSLFEPVPTIQALDEQIQAAEATVAALKKQKEELEKPATYSIGQRFIIREEEYLLAQVGFGMVCFVNLTTGNYFTDTIRVQHPNRITQEELDRLAQGCKVQSIK